VTAGDCERNFEYVQQAETIYGEFDGTVGLASDAALFIPFFFKLFHFFGRHTERTGVTLFQVRTIPLILKSPN